MVICKACDKGWLHWEENEKGWRLYDCEGALHSCFKGYLCYYKPLERIKKMVNIKKIAGELYYDLAFDAPQQTKNLFVGGPLSKDLQPDTIPQVSVADRFRLIEEEI